MDISDSLTETITVKSKTGITKEGDPTYSAGATMKGRVERYNVRESGGEGSALIAETRLFTIGAIATSDLVFFPEDNSADNATGRRPQRCEPMKDLDGVLSHHETVF